MTDTDTAELSGVVTGPGEDEVIFWRLLADHPGILADYKVNPLFTHRQEYTS